MLKRDAGVKDAGALLGAAAGLAELAYFVSLARAYAGAPISVVYPVVRGINPLLAVLVGTALLGERLVGVATVRDRLVRCNLREVGVGDDLVWGRKAL